MRLFQMNLDHDVLKQVAMGLILLVVIVPILFVWYGCRIEVPEGHFVPLMRKTGEDITNQMIVADTPDFKGPQSEPLKEGRHFKNPYSWWWPKPLQATIIPNGMVGVKVRKYGNPLPTGQVVARKDDEKGILKDPIMPGRYYINTWAYAVEEHPMVKIEPGFMGIVTLMVGKTPANPNVFVVQEGERGTQSSLLPPGTHPSYSNPHVHMVTPIDVRSQKFEMAGQNGVTFPSEDGFDIEVEGIIEWAPDIKKLPQLFVKYVDEKDLKVSGGIDNIQRKLILTHARSFTRTIGGQHKAVDYIPGSTRIRVQTEVERRLREACADEGLLVKSFVIRSAKPPAQIKQQYERREMAHRQTDRFDKEIEREIGSVVLEDAKPKLDAEGKPIREGGRIAQTIQERMKDREKKLGRSARISPSISAPPSSTAK